MAARILAEMTAYFGKMRLNPQVAGSGTLLAFSRSSTALSFASSSSNMQAFTKHLTGRKTMRISPSTMIALLGAALLCVAPSAYGQSSGAGAGATGGASIGTGAGTSGGASTSGTISSNAGAAAGSADANVRTGFS
jgi:hypothetical protein